MSWQDALRARLKSLSPKSRKRILFVWNLLSNPCRTILLVALLVRCRFYRYFLLESLVARKAKKHQINVVFLVTNVSMWKHDGLFRLMQKHPRFRPIVVSAMRPNESEEEQRVDQEQMEVFFSERGFEFVRGYDFQTRKWLSLESLSPDMLFYTQPYTDIVVPEYYFYKHWEALLCYVPYAFETTAERWTYNCPYQNSAWKIFLPTELHREDARSLSSVKAENCYVTGYPTADEYAAGSICNANAWRNTISKGKRIIWAPHHSILPAEMYGSSSFLQYCDAMLRLAKKYSGKAIFAFKPHPMLLTKLYKVWGKEKTDAYYAEWDNLENTFVSGGEYKDLFLESDALIHDCGSFSVEYLYVQKPTMFLYKQNRTARESEFGKRALDVHYAGYSIQDIERFVEEVVLGGNDPKKEERERFYNKYLLPPNGQSVAQNILDEIERGLGWK